MKRTQLISKLAVDLERALNLNGHTKNIKVKVGYEDGVLYVRGQARSYFQKQIILNLATRIRGSAEIEIGDGVTVS